MAIGAGDDDRFAIFIGEVGFALWIFTAPVGSEFAGLLQQLGMTFRTLIFSFRKHFAGGCQFRSWLREGNRGCLGGFFLIFPHVIFSCFEAEQRSQDAIGDLAADHLILTDGIIVFLTAALDASFQVFDTMHE